MIFFVSFPYFFLFSKVSINCSIQCYSIKLFHISKSILVCSHQLELIFCFLGVSFYLCLLSYWCIDFVNLLIMQKIPLDFSFETIMYYGKVDLRGFYSTNKFDITKHQTFFFYHTLLRKAKLKRLKSKRKKFYTFKKLNYVLSSIRKYKHSIWQFH